jgi:hypothetical protein
MLLLLLLANVRVPWSRRTPKNTKSDCVPLLARIAVAIAQREQASACARIQLSEPRFSLVSPTCLRSSMQVSRASEPATRVREWSTNWSTWFGLAWLGCRSEIFCW